MALHDQSHVSETEDESSEWDSTDDDDGFKNEPLSPSEGSGESCTDEPDEAAPEPRPKAKVSEPKTEPKEKPEAESKPKPKVAPEVGSLQSEAPAASPSKPHKEKSKAHRKKLQKRLAFRASADVGSTLSFKKGNRLASGIVVRANSECTIVHSTAHNHEFWLQYDGTDWVAMTVREVKTYIKTVLGRPVGAVLTEEDTEDCIEEIGYGRPQQLINAARRRQAQHKTGDSVSLPPVESEAPKRKIEEDVLVPEAKVQKIDKPAEPRTGDRQLVVDLANVMGTQLIELGTKLMQVVASQYK